MDEKATAPISYPSPRQQNDSSSVGYQPPLGRAPHTNFRFTQQPSRSNTTARFHTTYSRPRALRIANLIRPWLPLIMYGITSLGFVIAIGLYRSQVFSSLDELSRWLLADKQFGYAVLFLLIFLTTFPPVPLYSTFITLSGYTFGAWTGAVISYFAALSGALTVFVISRFCFRDMIARWLSSTLTIKRVVYAVEKRPKLLFLIRLAPYPYNVMNCILAAAPTLTLRTYAICTALSLFKVIIHTSMGASIHSFKDYHVVDPDRPDEEHHHTLAELWTGLGIALCIAILIYLSFVARKAVDDELEDELITSYDVEETVGFLAAQQPEFVRERGSAAGQVPMTESPFRSSQHPLPFRQSMEVDSSWT